MPGKGRTAYKRNQNRITATTAIVTGCRRALRIFILVAAVSGILAGSMPVTTVSAAEGYEKAASKNGKFEAEAVETYGMTPIAGSAVADGTWPVEIRSSSKYFRIREATLVVSGGKMKAEIRMDSTAYECMYPGLGIDAAKADRAAYIDVEKVDYGTTFTIDVPALNQAFPCAAFSKKRKKWYDRALLADASSLPAEALQVNVPDYSIVDAALEAYGEEHAEEVKSAREAFFGAEAAAQGIGSADGGSAAGGKDTGGSNAGDGSGSGTAEGTDSGKNGGSSAAGGAAGSGSGQTSGGIAGTGAGQNTEDLIVTMDEETMAALPEAVPVDLADGTYAIEVTMTGGSGRASVSSPTWLIVQNGKAFAKLLWSSMYYDYMIVGDRTYLNQTTDGGNSTFIIPVISLDEQMDVVADTTAMGDPVAIEYMLTFYEDTIGSKGQIPQEAAKKVLLLALAIMVVGGVINHLVKRRRSG